MDTVDVSTPSETKKKKAGKRGAGNVEALASPARVGVRMKERKRKRKEKTVNDGNLQVNRFKEGADVAVR
jgi:hypothetical protein